MTTHPEPLWARIGFWVSGVAFMAVAGPWLWGALPAMFAPFLVPLGLVTPQDVVRAINGAVEGWPAGAASLGLIGAMHFFAAHGGAE